MREWLKPRLQRGQRLEDVREARPEINTSLNRAERFLRLSALISVFMAAAAIALAAAAMWSATSMPWRCCARMGLTQGDIVGLFLRQYSLTGRAVGQLPVSATGLADPIRAWPTCWPACSKPPCRQPAPCRRWPALAVGLVLLFGFCLPPLLQAASGVSPLRVLRRDATPAGNAPLAFGLGLAALAGLIYWQAGDTTLAGLALAGLAGTVAVATLAAWCLVWITPKLPLPGQLGWRFGLANVARRRGLSVAQIVCAIAGPDGADVADGGAQRPAQCLGQVRPGRCPQPLRHQYPA